VLVAELEEYLNYRRQFHVACRDGTRRPHQTVSQGESFGLASSGARLRVWKSSNNDVPIAATVLIVLFAIQRWGSGKGGKLFESVMVAWFVVSAWAGIGKIIHQPRVVLARWIPAMRWRISRRNHLERPYQRLVQYAG
jgi:hypothetical protein